MKNLLSVRQHVINLNQIVTAECIHTGLVRLYCTNGTEIDVHGDVAKDLWRWLDENAHQASNKEAKTPAEPEPLSRIKVRHTT